MSGLADAPADASQLEEAREDEVTYAGLATRVIAFVIDAALISVVAIMVGVGAALIQGILHLPGGVQTLIQAIGAAIYVAATIGYFVAFWSSTGQTPGARVMQIRITTATGERVTTRRAFVRCVGVVLAALPLFAGFIRILFDARRRGFQDRLARTVVIGAPQQSLIGARRASLRSGSSPSPSRGDVSARQL
jgi:uncharacterized RDD family membrane protein YckC